MSDYPSLPEQGKNLAKFTFEVLKQALSSDALFVSDDIKAERLDICSKCEYYDETQVRCRHCGCFLEHKAGYAMDSCPVGKWSISDVDWMNGQFEEVMNQVENGGRKVQDPNVPNFPLNPNDDEVYEWNGHRWKWDGKIWDYVVE